MTACRRKPPKQPPLRNRISSLNYANPMAILLFSFFLIHHPVTTADVSPEEKKALLLFIQKVKHHSDYSWKESEPVCVPPKEDDNKEGVNWKGVTCDPTYNFVIRLRMPAASLVGEIPPGTIGNLVHLRVLSLHTNGLNGTIPDDFSNLKITHLYLHNNKISGQLPNMQSDEIEKFDVSNNKFTGSIPTSFSKFPESAFSRNINLCGDPLPPCKDGTVSPPPQQAASQAEEKTNDKSKSKEKGLIVGVSIGSGLILLIFLCCLRKRITKQSKQTPESPLQDLESASKAGGGGTSTEGERNKLVFLDAGIYSFDMDDLYGASTEVLGKGSFGTSLKAVMDGGTTVVVKRLKDVVVTKMEFESRMEVLGKMKNQHLIPLVAYYYSKDEKLLVYDYMSAGSLFAHLHNGSRGFGQTRLDWEHRMRIALSAARGVEYLHVVEKVVHGNIKSSNILFRQETNKDAYVSDYGLNTLFDGLSSQNHRVTGYQAPEVLKTREVTFESDVYSFGVLLLELLTGKDPNQTSLDKEGTEFPMWVQSITQEEPKVEVLDVELRRHQDIEEKMVQLLQIAKDCVLFEPDRRPTMHKVVRMMEDMNRVEMDDWLRQSSDDRSKPFDDTPSTDTRDTPSTITP